MLVTCRYHAGTMPMSNQFHVSVRPLSCSTISVSYQYHVSIMSVPCQYHASIKYPVSDGEYESSMMIVVHAVLMYYIYNMCHASIMLMSCQCHASTMSTSRQYMSVSCRDHASIKCPMSAREYECGLMTIVHVVLIYRLQLIIFEIYFCVLFPHKFYIKTQEMQVFPRVMPLGGSDCKTFCAAASDKDLVERVAHEIRTQRGEELPHFLPYRACQVVVSSLLKACVVFFFFLYSSSNAGHLRRKIFLSISTDHYMCVPSSY